MIKEEKYNLVCSFCKKGFYRKPSQIKPDQKKFYCSRSCLDQDVKMPLEIYQCAYCSKTLELKRNQTRNSKTGRHYCDNSCKNKHIATFGRGLKNTSSTSHRCRMDLLKILANNNCQQCNNCEDIRLLDIHHLDENHKNNNWDNLVVLCVLCHAKHHRGVSSLEVKPLIDDNIIADDKFKIYLNEKREEIYRIGAIKAAISKSEKYSYAESNHIKKNCKYCKKEFLTNKHKQLYCNHNCAEKDRYIVERPTKEELERLISEYSWEAIGRMYGVSGNAVKKWARNYEIPFETRSYNRM